MVNSQTITRNAAVLWALWLALLFGFANRGFAWDYGNGRHGSFVLATNATIEQLYQTVRLTNDPAQYNPADTNAIPNFQTLNITNGATLTANAWNGSSGGWIVCKVEGALSVAAGSSISVNGLGYRGGSSGVQGESYAGVQTTSMNANYGGGGGGFIEGHNSFGEVFYGSAGGGGYGSSGVGGITYLDNGTTGGAYGGLIYGSSTLDTIYLGSGGGGNVNGSTPTGGNGGGAIVIVAGNLRVNGQMKANGSSSAAGGGSGGSVRLQVASAALGQNNIAATGGTGSGGGYGNGGAGRIMVAYAESFTGTTAPAAYTLLDTNSDNVTVIINQPTSQTNFLGANVVFNVGVYGLPVLMFQWNLNGLPITGATNQVLSLTNIALTSTGDYSVTASNAVMTVVSSNAFLEVLDTAIPLGDGIPNWWKLQYGFSLSDPTLATNHPSGDRLTYLQKFLYGLNPLTIDNDGDGISDYDEIFLYHSNPLSANTAGDGIPDGWKVQHGMDALASNANNEVGFDGVSYLQVYQYNLAHPANQLDPRNPFSVGPAMSNYEIINGGQHTNRFYYDHEDRLIGMESSRGISIAYQYDGNGNLVRQIVLSRTGETNGLPVLWCFLNGLTNNPDPYADPDGDGWSNYQEWLAGTNPNDANSRPTVGGNVETAPYAVVLPSTSALGSIAVVSIRLWDDEGNASTPFLQYQILGSTNWQDAALFALDGMAYNPSNRVAALPGGVIHALAWNAMNDLGGNVITNVLLRACAQDFMLTGDWSQPTPFLVYMNQDSNGNGIPDWWELQYFGSLQPANGDYDGDGVSNYAEYIADTNPTDPNSYLHIIRAEAVPGGMRIEWQGGTWATQYLQQRTGLALTNGPWVDLFTNLPPTPNPSSFTNYAGTNCTMLYRIRVTR